MASFLGSLALCKAVQSRRPPVQQVVAEAAADKEELATAQALCSAGEATAVLEYQTQYQEEPSRRLV